MAEWQVIDPGQELTRRNGSAILGIACELRDAAETTGREAWVVGGVLGDGELPRCLPVLLPVERSSRFLRLFDMAMRYTFGSPYRPTLDIGDHSGSNPELIVLHNLPWAGKEMRARYPTARVILYVHNKILNGLPARAARRALAPFDEIVCVSDFIQKDLKKRSFSESKSGPRFRTVLNACRTNRDFPDAQPKYDVVYVGRIVEEKGVHIAAAAAALPGPRWAMAVVGGKYFVPGHESDGYVQGLLRQSSESDLRIEFTGPVAPPDVLRYLGAARVVVVPSVWDEPAGLALLEAMASPAAVVASHVGGMPELSRAGGVVYVPPGDPQALRDAVDSLLGDEQQRLSVAKLGQQEVQGWTWADAYERLKDH